jgi:hypothetical protein
MREIVRLSGLAGTDGPTGMPVAFAALRTWLFSWFSRRKEDEQTICYRKTAVSAQKKLVSAARRAPHLERATVGRESGETAWLPVAV